MALKYLFFPKNRPTAGGFAPRSPKPLAAGGSAPRPPSVLRLRYTTFLNTSLKLYISIFQLLLKALSLYKILVKCQPATILDLTEKFDVLRGRLVGNHNDFHWQLGGQINHQPCSCKAARVIRCTEMDSVVSSFQLSLAAHSFSNKVIPQLGKTLGRTGQTLRACTVAEAFKGINNFSLVVLKKNK